MTIRDRIVVFITTLGEFRGTADLAKVLDADPRHVHRHLRELAADGTLIYRPTRGGRGNKSVIRKGSQLGQARKVRYAR